MPFVLSNNGEGDAAAYFVNKAAPSDLVLRLFSNNITPAETDVAGTYTELTGAGYASKTLPGASWTVTEGAPTVASYVEQVWTFAAATGNIYGYYMTRLTGGRLALAERFPDAPWSFANAGDQAKITPRIEFD